MNALVSKAVPYVLAAAISGGWLVSHNAKQRALGAAAVRDSIKTARLDSFARVTARRDTLYVRDTVTKWRSIREVETLIDTLLHSDTVTLTVRESVFVARADTAIRMCRSIVLLCEQRVADRDSQIVALTTDRNEWRGRASPSLRDQAVSVGWHVGLWELTKAAVKAVKR